MSVHVSRRPCHEDGFQLETFRGFQPRRHEILDALGGESHEQRLPGLDVLQLRGYGIELGVEIGGDDVLRHRGCLLAPHVAHPLRVIPLAVGFQRKPTPRAEMFTSQFLRHNVWNRKRGGLFLIVVFKVAIVVIA